MGTDLDLIHQNLIWSVAVVLFIEAVILLLRGNNNMARRTLGYVTLMWSIVYILRAIGFFTGLFPDSYSMYRVNVLIIGYIYIAVMTFFPIQALIPGWLTWKRAALLFVPVVLIAGFYFLVMAILGQQPLDLQSYAQIKASLGRFDVWYRFFILLTNLIYMTLVLSWLYGYEKRYVQWKNENYADQDYVDISWMRMFDIFVALIFILYLCVLVFGTKIPVIFHSLSVLVGFTYFFYKGLFYESAYPANFFKEKTSPVDSAEVPMGTANVSVDELTDENETISFDSRIPAYIESVTRWMERDLPYLDKDFKLTDVSKVLPLNRSYLSRVFNEGFGRNFSEVTRSYRVKYAQDLMQKQAEIPLSTIAERSGFSSHSTFIRAFKQETGITPTQYKSYTKG